MEDLDESETLQGSIIQGHIPGVNTKEPFVDTLTQIGGRTFLAQLPDDPMCPACEDSSELMYFLMSIHGDDKRAVGVIYKYVDIVAWICSRCGAILIRHFV
jgi:rubredoxin